MERTQFRTLFREFLFRLVDLEILAERADVTKLLGQFAAMLAAASLMLAGGAVRLTYNQLPREEKLAAAWPNEHFLIATTMMVVGLFAVLCWDSSFPDSRDVLVLGPLPVRTRTLLLAKLASLGAALALTVLAVNVFTGISYPLVLGSIGGGVLAILRSAAAYWLTMLAAGAFMLFAMLGMQGMAAQLLPRRYFLRLSASLQLLTFCLILSVYFLQPQLATPQALGAPENRQLVGWLPSYWFLGLFQILNGSLHPVIEPLGWRGATAFAIAFAGASGAFLLCYFRTLRKTVEEPDIVPGPRHAGWRLEFGDSLQTAVVAFCARTLLRSRQHRLILALYLGVGFAIALACCRALFYGDYGYAGPPWRQVNRPFLVASIMMMCFVVAGMRVVFALPHWLRANWVFRVTMIREPAQYLAAVRRSLILLAVAPAWVVSAAAFLSIWPAVPVLGHLVVLGILGFILTELCLHGFPKIPFTCSYLPGKASIHVTSGAYALVLLAITDAGVWFEIRALSDLAGFAAMLGVLGAAAYWVRRRTATRARSGDQALRFEEIPADPLLTLQLRRDGVVLSD